MQPNSVRPQRPRLTRRSREHRLSDAPPDELFDKSEVRDLDGTVVAPLELEVAGAFAVDEALPHGDLRSAQMRGQPLVAPRVAIPPVPTISDRAVQSAVLADAD